MAWDHLSITKPHLVYIILGGFTSLFMLCSSVIKERMYIGEATVATLCGVIFGPHAANLINPDSWGNVDETTLEFSRIVLVVQCFAVGVELPKYYMEKHWKSVVFLLIPVMTFGWLITSLIIWWLFPILSWLESLVVAACVTATDPVLASSVVGKGKFAKRVPKHLRDVLSAESGCNDGMAFPFIYLSLYLLQENLDAKQTTYHWLVYTVLYECIFGAVYGFLIGYIARHGIKFAEKHDLIDRESFLVFYFTLALFCAGSGSILGVDDLLVGFAAGVGFSNDGWFSEKTEESHVSNVIDLLLNLAYFVYLGTIIPWEQYNDYSIGLSAWRLTVMAIFVILFRRIPIMMLLKPFIPDIKTWREALFAGHFGPIGVGAIFVALLARAELETEHSIPEAELPEAGTKFYNVILLVWPIVTFMVVASILVHGSSVAVFTLGKRINTLQLTMSFTTAPEDGHTWMNRLPRISSLSRSQARTNSDTDFEEIKSPDFPPGTLGPVGLPGQFLRRQREEDNPSRAGSRASSLSGRRRSRKKWDDGIGPGGPVSQSAIFPQRKSTSEITEPMSPSDSVPPLSPRQESPSSPSDESPEKDSEKDIEKTLDARKEQEAELKAVHELEREAGQEGPRRRQRHEELEVYDEGDHIVIEDHEGQVLAVQETGHKSKDLHEVKEKARAEVQKPGWTYDSLKKSIGKWRDEEAQKRKEKTKTERKHEPARAYQFGNTIIVEDVDGEVVRKYDLPSDGKDYVATSLKYMGMGGLVKPSDKSATQAGESSAAQAGEPKPPARARTAGWPGFNRGGAAEQRRRDATSPTGRRSEDDRGIRFTIGGAGRRLNKDDFLSEVQKLDARTRREVVDQSSAPPAIKSMATEEPGTSAPNVEQPPVHPHISVTQASTSSRDGSESPTRPEPARGRSATVGSDQVPLDAPETAAERRRRLAAFASVREDNDTEETPAERRRREAALGVDSGTADDSDSDDDDTPRVPPARRGIRFADSPPNKG
ncbi:alkali metal cation/H+ antiporter Nha1 C terminus-domain-containing protein [Annulohypoxylon maeteangense]|uniref:alkali metal cation/H+ antiporter Nha1 C terminus-domain-containing protein n=1 Tax=Annulohypoxylon maeteangense TaxID=1927788 RepID=UPI00200838E7|nr:alkali metal cation/H+ antiporter Nha1 C terminus-domain-containing protein [Annulohypoxylon maeteangense]KAI0881987.1 alkali metal cation/H+ antiporter Nha1 C terminus-domain-containing protein [Annulohypoxylon maeteangense]